MSAAVSCTDGTALLNDTSIAAAPYVWDINVGGPNCTKHQPRNSGDAIPKQLKSKIQQQLLVRGPTNVIFSKIDIILPGLQGLKETQTTMGTVPGREFPGTEISFWLRSTC